MREVIADAETIDHRPADDIPPQMVSLGLMLAAKGYPDASPEDVLTYALFAANRQPIGERALEFFLETGSRGGSDFDVIAEVSDTARKSGCGFVWIATREVLGTEIVVASPTAQHVIDG